MMKSSRRSFLKQVSLSTLGLWGHRGFAESAGVLLPRGSALEAGVSEAGIMAFLEAIDAAQMELHSLMILRHGKVIAEGWWDPYGPQFVHTMYSMSKSFTSTAVGLAVAEGKMSVDDKVISFFPDDLPAKISDNLAAMKVKHLLTMTPGNEREPTGKVVSTENWVRTFLAQEISHEPGTDFIYNSVATYMCSAIVQKVTGQTVLEYLTPRLFMPLGISGMRWETCPRGINTGGWGLSIQTEGLAKFGQLLLQKGQWKGNQILPAAWVEEATRFHVQQPGGDKPDRPKAKNDWLQGYGYQFWRCQGTAFRGDGAFGQFTIVLPEQDAVIVMTSENKNMQGQLDLVWQHLLPAFDAHEAAPMLDQTLKKLALAPLQGSRTSPTTVKLAGKTISFDLRNDLNIEKASFTFSEGSCEFAVAGGSVKCGIGQWQRGEAAVPGTPPRLISGGAPKGNPLTKIAASAAWADETTLVMKWRYYETPHSDLVSCKIDGDKITLSFLSSITAMNPKAKDLRAPLIGRLVG
jgi:CubicO group peptidase (beta-lactamase class C family)